jgi:ribonucleotide reductase alpha subunit
MASCPCSGASNPQRLCLSDITFSFRRVFNACARYVDQGGGKRPGPSSCIITVRFHSLSPGAFAIYLEPWHADVEVKYLYHRHHFFISSVCRFFLSCARITAARSTGPATCFTHFGSQIFSCAGWRPRRSGRCSVLPKPLACRRPFVCFENSIVCSLNPAVTIHTAKSLIVSTSSAQQSHSLTLDRIYVTACRYEAEGKARKTIMARDLWFQVLESQIETGTPYLLYKVTHFCGLGDSQNIHFSDKLPSGRCQR